MFMKSVCFSVFTLLCYTFVCNRGAIQCVCFCICLVLEISVYCVFKWVWSSLEDFFIIIIKYETYHCALWKHCKALRI